MMEIKINNVILSNQSIKIRVSINLKIGPELILHIIKAPTQLSRTKLAMVK